MKGKEQSHDLEAFKIESDNSKWKSRGCFSWDMHSVEGEPQSYRSISLDGISFSHPIFQTRASRVCCGTPGAGVQPPSHFLSPALEVFQVLLSTWLKWNHISWKPFPYRVPCERGSNRGIAVRIGGWKHSGTIIV